MALKNNKVIRYLKRQKNYFIVNHSLIVQNLSGQ